MKKFGSKKYLLLFILGISVFFLFFLKFEFHRALAKIILTPGLKNSIYESILGKQEWKDLQNIRKSNYNLSVLPKTTYEFIKLEKIPSDIDLRVSTHGRGGIIKTKKFFLENINNEFLITSFNGKTKIIKSLEPYQTRELLNDLPNSKIYSVMDVAIIKDYVYLSASMSSNQIVEKTYEKNKTERTCQFLQVFRAKFNEEELKFKNIFEPKICLQDIEGGRIHEYKLNNKEGFLLTTSARNAPRSLGGAVDAQKDNSPFGKILFFSFDNIDNKNSSYEIVSKGHRNPQGLLVHEDIILETEHGPKGGDEINKIEVGKNYGFPNVSIGDIYSFPDKSRPEFLFKKNHSKNGFEEPIFTFVPSIGIQQIINIPNNFSKYWQDNFLITSLNGRSLYRVQFSNKFNKIIFTEKIYIGERIRDIVYDNKLNIFLLALEDTGSVGLLMSPQSQNY